jgi:hypothetical protein
LACQAVLEAITYVDFAAENADEFVPDGPLATTFKDAISQDPIATVQSLVRAVSLYA